MFNTGNALLRRLVRIGVLEESKMKLDYVLGLRLEDFLERRLQTQVFKLGLAKSIHHARVLIRQRHIRYFIVLMKLFSLVLFPKAIIVIVWLLWFKENLCVIMNEVLFVFQEVSLVNYHGKPLSHTTPVCALCLPLVFRQAIVYCLGPYLLMSLIWRIRPLEI